MVAGSNRQAPAWWFSVQICCMFSIPQYRRKSDLGLCITLELANKMRLRGADFQLQNKFGRKVGQKLALRSGILFASP